MLNEKNLRCAKCGSTAIVPRARVVDRGDYGADSGNVRLAVARRPHALVFKNSELADVVARVCGVCGFVELYCEEAKAVFAAYEQSRQTSE